MHQPVTDPKMTDKSLLFQAYLKGRRDRLEGRPIPELMDLWTAEECDAAYRGFEEAVWSEESV